MATLTFNGRLPGVVCQTALPAAGEEPLRLDVAAFIGFAERGPLHTPVALEDLGQYRALFGGDLQLARDGGRPVYAHLPQAVQAFFDNGGRRCYAVRVAGDGARPNRFRLPGLVSWSRAQGLRSVIAPAAWVGRWSDGLTVATQLRRRPLPFQGPLALTADAVAFTVELPTDVSLIAGDVVAARLVAGLLDLELVMPVAQVQLLGTPVATGRGTPVRVRAMRSALLGLANAPGETSPQARAVERLDEQGWQLVVDDPTALVLAHDAVTGVWRLTLPGDAGVARGDLLRLTTLLGAVAFFPVTEVALAEGSLSPLGAPAMAALSDRVQWPTALDELVVPPADTLDLAQVELLTFDLHVREGEDSEAWPERRFNAGPGYWIDALAPAPAQPAEAESLITGQRSLRLAAPALDAAADPVFYLPLGMDPLLDASSFVGPLADADISGKDGLDRFDPVSLFLDGRLANCGVRDLVNEADRLTLLDPTVALRGLHSVLSVDEVALIAIPDAAHRAWPAYIAPPELPPLPPLPPPEPPDWSRFQDCPEPPPDVELSPVEVVAQFYTAFQRVGDEAALAYLTQGLIDELAGRPLAQLLAVERRPDSFTVDGPACQPGPGIPVRVRGVVHLVGEADVAHVFTLVHQAEGWRIRVVVAQTASQVGADPLRTLALLPAVQSPREYDLAPLLAVHAAVATLAAGRGDVVALLSLPEHFEPRDALAWAQQLTGSGKLMEGHALSYAAVYHPWLQVPEPVTPQLALLRSVPPDGAVAGSIAARELDRGPWIAAANMPLLGVVGLSQALTDADAVALFDAQANLLRQQPGRFVAISAHTLSLDPTLVQLPVRRLLIFLRKLALRRGMRYVFESNNERFRRRVEIAFERTLATLAAQGALTAFQVVMGEGLNTANDMDNGRFLIALKVAPALPIEFITVLLLRSGEGLLRAVEV